MINKFFVEKNNSILLIHAESPDLFKNNNHVVESETVAIEQMIKLAKKNNSAVICEIMNEDGTMAKGKQLFTFSKKHKFIIHCF